MCVLEGGGCVCGGVCHCYYYSSNFGLLNTPSFAYHVAMAMNP